MNNKEMATELELAVQILSLITLSGDAVDAMAAAKQKVRAVRDELNKPDSQAGEGVDDG